MPEISQSKYLVMAGWDDVPHLEERTKTELLGSTPPHLRDARSKGIPSLGSGAIYPVPESDITVTPFEIPAHWKKVYAMDVGWNRTAVTWGAIDPDSGVTYIFSEHYQGQAEPAIHAQAIKGRGKWIPGVIDPAARGRSQFDGERLFNTYKELGLDLTKAKNAVEAGIYVVWQALSTGRLKIFKPCNNWFAEYRIYRRDEKGHVVKEHDHLMDATRYMMMSGLSVAKVYMPSAEFSINDMSQVRKAWS